MYLHSHDSLQMTDTINQQMLYVMSVHIFLYKKQQQKPDKKKKEKVAYIILTFPQDYEQSVQQYKLNWCPELNWCLAVWIWVCMS